MSSEESKPGTPVPPPNGLPDEQARPGEPQVPSYTSPEDAYARYEDPYEESPSADWPAPAVVPPPPPPAIPPSPPVAEEEEEDEDDEGMLRMSFLGHLEELRSRLLYALAGIGIAFFVSLTFTKELWLIIQEPATSALKQLGVDPPELVFTTPTEAFSIIWVKLPLLVSIFLASPWLLYQVWGFIAPGLYKRERRFAAPFILCSAGLFIAGALFAYFIAFRYGLVFLLSIGTGYGIRAMVTIGSYFDIFVNVILGIAVVFELPMLIFFLTLLRIVSPGFLIRNARYAVLLIVVLAAVITPTADIINLMLLAVPMVLLYFVGVFASYLLVLSRENRRFPWRTFLLALGIPLALIGTGLYLAVVRLGYKLVLQWPFLVR